VFTIPLNYGILLLQSLIGCIKKASEASSMNGS